MYKGGEAPFWGGWVWEDTWPSPRTYAIINPVSAKVNKKEPKVAEKPMLDLKTFIENVNKKDKLNGLKIRFGFTKRKR